jgi:hypothetical protein
MLKTEVPTSEITPTAQVETGTSHYTITDQSLAEVHDWLHTTPLETLWPEERAGKPGKDGGVYDAEDYRGSGSYDLMMFVDGGDSSQGVSMTRVEFIQLKWFLAQLRGHLTRDGYEAVVIADYNARRETLNQRIIADLKGLTQQYEGDSGQAQSV